ncbi:hypothetical protein GWI33_012835 [Rhynchophorus ferrugineus]|uniref:Uncharacterized protein n=1 Tax=Rhynchophorus ferrugineus TaxID=354439 RepID=A0A834M8G2_RHYFE|nr:hypothetical protein GWI33_012835 [Rhynchophorus ferrugineus]
MDFCNNVEKSYFSDTFKILKKFAPYKCTAVKEGRIPSTAEGSDAVLSHHENIILPKCQRVTEENIDKASLEKNLVKIRHSINHCGQHVRHFIGTSLHLEFERLRVFTEQLISSKQSRITGQNGRSSLEKADISFDNIRFYVKIVEHPEIVPPYSTYYLLLLKNGSTVLASNIAHMNIALFVEFFGPYVFKDLPASFLIKAELYSVRFLLSSKLGGRFASSHYRSPPELKLIGESIIDLNNAKDGKFTFSEGGNNNKDIGVMISTVKISPKY